MRPVESGRGEREVQEREEGDRGRTGSANDAERDGGHGLTGEAKGEGAGRRRGKRAE
jgi:hypothetical protein